MDNNKFPQNNGSDNNAPQQPENDFQQTPQQPLNAEAQPEAPASPSNMNGQTEPPVEPVAPAESDSLPPQEQPQSPFGSGFQPQQPYGANNQPYGTNNQPYGQPANGGNSPFGVNSQHHFNTQQNNPFMSRPQNNQIINDPAAHTKGLISTICGVASIVLIIISMISCGVCYCSVIDASNSWNFSGASSSYNMAVILPVIFSLIVAAGIVGIVLSAMGKKTSNDPLLTAGLVLSIVGTVIAFIALISFSCICVCHCGTSTYVSTYNNLFS